MAFPQEIQSGRLPPGKEYHVFLSYRNADDDAVWVRNLAEKLKTEYNLICYDHSVDFQPGRNIVENIKYGVESSVKTLIILSKEYVSSSWCIFEVGLVHQMSMETRQKLIIPVIKEDCDIPDHIKPLTYIDARGDMELWIPRLVAAIHSPEDGSKDGHTWYDPDTWFRNLETVHEVSSTIGCRQKSFNTTNYVPDALNKRYFNMDADLYNNLLNEISQSRFFRLRLLCLPWCPSVCCFVMIFGTIAFFLAIYIVSVQQIPHQSENLNMPTVNSTISTYKTAMAFVSWGAIFLATILWPIGCCIYIHQKRKWFNKTLVSVNRKLITHNLIIAYRIVRRTATLKILFIYYYYQPCMENIYSILRRELMNQHDTTESNTLTFEETTRLLDDDNVVINSNRVIELTRDVSADSTVLKTVFNMGQNESNVDDTRLVAETYNDGDDDITVPLIQENSINNEESSVENMMREITEATTINLSADYIQDFIDEKLDNIGTKRHTSRGMCLCQYAELKRRKIDITDERRIIVV